MSFSWSRWCGIQHLLWKTEVFVYRRWGTFQKPLPSWNKKLYHCPLCMRYECSHIHQHLLKTKSVWMCLNFLISHGMAGLWLVWEILNHWLRVWEKTNTWSWSHLRLLIYPSVFFPSHKLQWIQKLFGNKNRERAWHLLASGLPVKLPVIALNARLLLLIGRISSQEK